MYEWFGLGTHLRNPQWPWGLSPTVWTALFSQGKNNIYFKWLVESVFIPSSLLLLPSPHISLMLINNLLLRKEEGQSIPALFCTIIMSPARLPLWVVDAFLLGMWAITFMCQWPCDTSGFSFRLTQVWDNTNPSYQVITFSTSDWQMTGYCVFRAAYVHSWLLSCLLFFLLSLTHRSPSWSRKTKSIQHMPRYGGIDQEFTVAKHLMMCSVAWMAV